MSDEHNVEMRDTQERVTTSHSHVDNAELVQDWVITGKSKEESELFTPKPSHESSSQSFYVGDNRVDGSTQVVDDSPYDGN